MTTFPSHRMRASVQFVFSFILPGAYLSLWSQTPVWHKGVAKVSTKSGSTGTGFVVAIKGGSAYLVTSAHVLETDGNPRVNFQADAERSFTAVVVDLQEDRLRGMALLKVSDPPAAVRIIPPGQAAQGNRVQVVGYPAPHARFSVLDLVISRIDGEDLILSPQTPAGYSGGPVVSGNAAAGLVFGTDKDGKALKLSRIQGYVEGHELSWSGARSPETTGPAVEINIGGLWRDTTVGNMTQITQRGDKFTFTAWGIACRGAFTSSGTGTIKGNKVESVYQSTYSQGHCSGTVSPDGKWSTGTCSDSVCGDFPSTTVKQ